jgi:hypothetical protein
MCVCVNSFLHSGQVTIQRGGGMFGKIQYSVYPIQYRQPLKKVLSFRGNECGAKANGSLVSLSRPSAPCAATTFGRRAPFSPVAYAVWRSNRLRGPCSRIRHPSGFHLAQSCWNFTVRRKQMFHFECGTANGIITSLWIPKNSMSPERMMSARPGQMVQQH